MKRPRWTSRIPPENDCSSLCSTLFTTDFFVAFGGRHLSNSSLWEFSEVDVNFVAIRPEQRKKLAKIWSKCYLLFYIRYGISEKGKTNHERSCQLIAFISKTDSLRLKTRYKDESACLWWKQLKWNKSPFYGDRVSGKIIHGNYQRRQRVWENHLRGTNSPDKVTGCLEEWLWTIDWKTK